MQAIVADINVQGHVRILLHILESDAWRDLWAGLNLDVLTLRDLGLERNASDATVWHTCQQRQAVLITNNRHADTPDSLETTIQAHNTPTSLPVFTLANAEEIRHNRDYAERVVERLLDLLFTIDNLRGTGRIYLP